MAGDKWRQKVYDGRGQRVYSGRQRVVGRQGLCEAGRRRVVGRVWWQRAAEKHWERVVGVEDVKESGGRV